MLTSIRNAISVNTFDVTVPYSKAKWYILKVFEELKLVQEIPRDDTKRALRFIVTHDEKNVPSFTNLKRLSSPSRRVYVGWKDIPRPSRNGVILISTSQGVMTGRTARNRHLGGELICEIS